MREVFLSRLVYQTIGSLAVDPLLSIVIHKQIGARKSVAQGTIFHELSRNRFWLANKNDRKP